MLVTLSEQLVNFVEYIQMVDEGRKMTPEEKDNRWGPVVGSFDSSSDPSKKYEVRRRAKNQYSCQCNGWVFHKHCKHCDLAAKKRGETQDTYDYNTPVDLGGKSDKAA